MKHKSLEELAMEKQNWGILHMIKNMDSASRIEAMESVCQYAMLNRDESRAIEAVEFLKAAYFDNIVTSFLEAKAKEASPGIYDDQTPKKSVQEELAKNLMQLYPLLVPRSDKTRGFPKLLEIKRNMLSEIANCWRETDDEEIANEIVLFIAGLKMPYNDQDEKKMILDVIRNASKDWFPVPRLSKSFLSIQKTKVTSAGDTPLSHDVRQTLAIARVREKMRGIGDEEMIGEMQVVSQLDGCSLGAFAYIAEQAKKVGELDKEIRELTAKIEHECFLYHLTKFSYIDSTHVLIDIDMICGNASAGTETEKDMHEKFEKARDCIRAWRKGTEHQFIRVTLTINIREWSTQTPPAKRRSETI
jgi:hypothetical protein